MELCPPLAPPPPRQKKKWQKSAIFGKFWDFCPPPQDAFCPLDAPPPQKKFLVPPLGKGALPPCNPGPTRGQPSGPLRTLWTPTQVLGLLKLHPVQRTSRDEPLFFYHPWALQYNKKKFIYRPTSGSARSSMPNVLKYILKSVIEGCSYFSEGGVTKILAPG